jgi:hypothetical protein
MFEKEISKYQDQLDIIFPWCPLKTTNVNTMFPTIYINKNKNSLIALIIWVFLVLGTPPIYNNLCSCKIQDSGSIMNSLNALIFNLFNLNIMRSSFLIELWVSINFGQRGL